MAKLSNHYEGHPQLKGAGVTIDITPEQMQELVRCQKDCLYFVENYIKIIDVDEGLVSFKPYPYQKRIIDAVVNNRYSIAKLARQSGKTTIVAAILLWYFLFNEYWDIAILANKEMQAIEILGRIKLSYEQLPFWLQQGIVRWAEKQIEAENGSTIFASATSSSAIRGRAINILMLDEFAHVDAGTQSDFFTSVFPTISSGKNTKAIITSTPNGLEMFYKIWTDSENGRNQFKKIDSHWSEKPGRDNKWRQEQLEIMSEEKFDQEYGTDFLGSSATLISGSVLRTLTAENPIAYSDHLRVYEHPQKDHHYVMCVDTAEGTNRDNSAFIVVDITYLPYRIVAAYTDNTVVTFIYPNVIFPIASRYNNAAILIETNNGGQQVADILHSDLEYEPILMTTSSGRNGVSLCLGFNQQARLGVRTTVLTKRIGCVNLKTIVENRKLEFHDNQLIQELSKFTLQGKSYKAEPGDGNTDDLVMCCVLFGWLQTQGYIQENTDIDIRKNLLVQHAMSIEAESWPVGFLEDGRDQQDTVIDLDAWLRDA